MSTIDMSKETTARSAMKLALEALEYIEHNYMSLPAPAEKAITALREALAEQPAQQEYERGFIDGMQEQMRRSVDRAVNAMAQRTWVGLTDEEIFLVLGKLQAIYNRPPTEDSRIVFAQAIEAKLKAKNFA